MPKIDFESVMLLGLPVDFYETTIYTTIQKENWHEYVELIFAVEGSGYVKVDSEYIPIEKNEFCIINSYLLHGAKGNPEGFHFYNLLISADFCNYNGLDIKNFTFETKFRDDELKNKLLSLYIAYRNRLDPFHYAHVSLAFLDFMIHLVKYHASPTAKQNEQQDIALAIGYIRSHIDKKMTVDEIAKQSGLSKYHFERKFKKEIGCSVLDYINKLRCTEICRKLNSSSATIKECFEMSCFSNYSYFAKMFKKHIGISPSQYKKECDRKNSCNKPSGG